MLVATLNYNMPDLTDNLVNQLRKDPFISRCEIMVVDNGSDKAEFAKSTTHKLDENIFFGGGFNVVLEYFLSTKHDYLYFLNNDLIFHGNAFLSTSIKEAKSVDAAVYSPTVINASIDQCYWRQMWNWGMGLREVRWIDFQSPLIRRDVLEKIQHYPDPLIYGWGLDLYTGCIMHNTDLKTFVSDNNTICHLNSHTLKSDKSPMPLNDYCHKASTLQNQYFFHSEYKELFYDLRKYGESYSPISNAHNVV